MLRQAAEISLFLAVFISFPTPARAARAKASNDYGRVALTFEHQDDRFVAQGAGYRLSVERSQAVFRLGEATVRMRFAGSGGDSRMTGRQLLKETSSYIMGADPRLWRTMQLYERVEIESLYPGVTASFYGNETAIEYDLKLEAGADLSKVLLQFDGQQGIRLDADGNLILETAAGALRQLRPTVYQTGSGRKPISGRYLLRPGGEVAFELEGYDPAQPVVIDPVLEYTRAMSLETPTAIATDAEGNAYMAGTIPSATGRDLDVVVAKIDPSGRMRLFQMNLGGSGNDIPTGIAVDATGGVYVAGYTTSRDFPVSGGFRAKPNGGVDGFVVKINSKGTAVEYATYLGGGGDDSIAGVAVDHDGAAYLTGWTTSDNFPVRDASHSSHSGARNAFVSKLSPDGGSLAFSSYLSLADRTDGTTIAVDDEGAGYIAGSTMGGDGQHAFLVKYRDGRVAWSKRIAASGSEAAGGIAVDSSHAVYVTGWTTSADFPVTSGSRHAGGRDVFAIKFSEEGPEMLWAALVGGSTDDAGQTIAVDAAGSVYIGGVTSSPDFPLAGELDVHAPNAAFLVKLDADGRTRLTSTRVAAGSTATMAVGASGQAILAGSALAAAAKSAGYLAKVSTCEYRLSNAYETFGVGGETRSFNIETAPECGWTATAHVPWVSVSGAGKGNGRITYAIEDNPGAPRGATIAVGGQTVFITQAGVMGPVGAISVVPPVRANTGFFANSIAACDDCSASAITNLGFTASFYGTNYTQVWVNNNGNISFGSSTSQYTPSPISTLTGRVIIAPFWADVDTRGTGSGLTTYGTDTVDGRAAFAANWVNVGYYSYGVDKLNSFQVVLISRPDQAPGAFDIEFNYSSIAWETGRASGGTNGLGGFSARAGYTNGSGTAGTSFELPGSGVNGALLDGGPNSLAGNSVNSGGVRGRYIYPIRGSSGNACAFSGISPTSTSVGVTGGTISGISVSIAGGCTWTVGGQPSWITVASPAGGTGTGPGSVTLSVANNTGGQHRSTVVTIAGQAFTVVQAGACSLTLPANTGTALPGGGTGSFQVTSSETSCAWTASISPATPGATVTPSGVGTGQVAWTLPANTASANQTYAITMNPGAVTYNLTQLGGPCSSPNAFSLAGGYYFSLPGSSSGDPRPFGYMFEQNGTYTTSSAAWMGINTSCSWTITGIPTWVHFLGATSGTGNGSLRFSVDSTTVERWATMNVGATTFTIYQRGPVGCTYSVSNPYIAVPAAGGSTALTLNTQTGCPWIVTQPGGGTITPSSGTGPATLNVNMTANTTQQARGGQMFVKPSNIATCSWVAPNLTCAMFDVYQGTQWNGYSCSFNSNAVNITQKEGAVKVGDIVITCSGTAPVNGIVTDVYVSMVQPTPHRFTYPREFMYGPNPNDRQMMINSEYLLLINDPVTPVLGVNAFQASGGHLWFPRVPIAPPGGAVTNYKMRITNIRVDATHAVPGQSVAAEVGFNLPCYLGYCPIFVGMDPWPGRVTLANVVNSGYTFTAGTPIAGPNANQVIIPVTFSASQSSLYLPRITPTQDPSFAGVAYQSQSGYVNSVVTGPMAGFADFGTRLFFVLGNLPTPSYWPPSQRVYVQVNTAANPTWQATNCNDQTGRGGAPVAATTTTNGLPYVYANYRNDQKYYGMVEVMNAGTSSFTFNILIDGMTVAQASQVSLAGQLAPLLTYSWDPVPTFANTGTPAPAPYNINLSQDLVMYWTRPSPYSGTRRSESATAAAPSNQALLTITARVPNATPCVPAGADDHSCDVPVSGTLTSGLTVAGTCVASGGVCTAAMGGRSYSAVFLAMAPGQSATIQIPVNVDPAAGGTSRVEGGPLFATSSLTASITNAITINVAPPVAGGYKLTSSAGELTGDPPYVIPFQRGQTMNICVVSTSGANFLNWADGATTSNCRDFADAGEPKSYTANFSSPPVSGGVLTSPANGSTLPVGAVTFTWTQGGVGTTGYKLEIGSRTGASCPASSAAFTADVFSQEIFSATQTSLQVYAPPLPQDGRPVCVRLSIYANGSYAPANLYGFTSSTSACRFSISPPSAFVGNGSGTTASLTGTFTLTATSCTPAHLWAAVSDSPRLLVTSGAAGNGATTTSVIGYSMFTNSTTQTRTAHITVGGQTFTVTQAGSVETQAQRVVRALYQTILGREPDGGGWAFWTGPGAPVGSGGAVLYNQMADGFYTSPEFRNSGFAVLSIYQAVTNQLPTFPQWYDAVTKLRQGTQSAVQLTDLLAGSASLSTFVSQSHVNGCGHSPTSAELANWTAGLTNGTYSSKFDFLNRVLFADPDFMNQTNGAFLKAMYFTILLRDPDPGGFTFWTGQLTNSPGMPGIYYIYLTPPAAYAMKLAIIGQAVPPNPNLLGFLGSPEFQGLIQ